eukprot:scaffold8692_cov134-Isochrysis_galbana.AAC.3
MAGAPIAGASSACCRPMARARRSKAVRLGASCVRCPLGVSPPLRSGRGIVGARASATSRRPPARRAPRPPREGPEIASPHCGQRRRTATADGTGRSAAHTIQLPRAPGHGTDARSHDCRFGPLLRPLVPPPCTVTCSWLLHCARLHSGLCATPTGDHWVLS